MKAALAVMLLAVVGCGRDASFAYCQDEHTMFEHWAAGTVKGGQDGVDDLVDCNAPRGCVQTPAPVCYQDSIPSTPGSK